MNQVCCSRHFSWHCRKFKKKRRKTQKSDEIFSFVWNWINYAAPPPLESICQPSQTSSSLISFFFEFLLTPENNFSKKSKKKWKLKFDFNFRFIIFFNFSRVGVHVCVSVQSPLCNIPPAVKDDVISSLRWLYTNTLHSSLKQKERKIPPPPCLSLSQKKNKLGSSALSLYLSLALNSFLSLYLSLSSLFLCVLNNYCLDLIVILQWTFWFPVSKRNGKDKEEKPTKKMIFLSVCWCIRYIQNKTKKKKIIRDNLNKNHLRHPINLTGWFSTTL